MTESTMHRLGDSRWRLGEDKATKADQRPVITFGSQVSAIGYLIRGFQVQVQVLSLHLNPFPHPHLQPRPGT
jgi:hypothetical protein